MLCIDLSDLDAFLQLVADLGIKDYEYEQLVMNSEARFDFKSDTDRETVLQALRGQPNLPHRLV